VLNQTAGSYLKRFGEQIFGSLGSVSAQVTFTDLGADDFSGTCHFKAFRRCLMSFQFVFSTTCFAGHD
jgi:hypothetical protein